jgi:DnaJ like chaperone protein
MKVQKLWISVVVGILFATLYSISNQDSFSNDTPIILIITVTSGAFILLALILHVAIISPIIHHFNKNKGYLAREKKLLDGLLKIVAELIKVDGNTDQTELQFIRKTLESDLGEADAELYMELLHEYLQSPQDIKTVCRKIDYELDELSKSQLMYLLMGIATADGVLSNKELDLMKHIMTWADLPPKTFIQASRFYNYKREKTYEEQSREQANQQNRTARRSALKSAYQLLDIPQNASESAIKAAYRTLAKIHHPDRYAHRGPLEQKKAKEQFQLIAEAYEMVKENRGF